MNLRSIFQQLAKALAIGALCAVSAGAFSQPGKGGHSGRFQAIPSDRTISAYLERISWTNNISYRWEAPAGADYAIVDTTRLNWYGELDEATSYEEAVENLLRSVHYKNLSNLGIVPRGVTDEGRPEGEDILATLYRTNSTFIVQTADVSAAHSSREMGSTPTPSR